MEQTRKYCQHLHAQQNLNFIRWNYKGNSVILLHFYINLYTSINSDKSVDYIQNLMKLLLLYK